MKYLIIGSPGQVAAIDFGCNLTLAKRHCQPAQFSNARPALVLATTRTKRDANLWLRRCEAALAYLSGRLGRWLAPTFVVVAKGAK